MPVACQWHAEMPGDVILPMQERIRAVDSWKNGPPRRDCVFVVEDQNESGFRGLQVARVQHFIAVHHNHKLFSATVVNWFSTFGNEPDPVTGMWIVTPDYDDDGERSVDIISLDSILQGAHLIGIAGKEWIPNDHSFTDTLDDFNSFFVNKYIDHHAYEIAF
uniref:Uncharacterized protein n=1 Tax=Moniliophthora roreri TaxID=221103 RepID=A0A0W0FJG6_MONRR